MDEFGGSISHVKEAFNAIAVLLGVTASLAWVNAKWIKLPGGVGLAFCGVLTAILLSGIGYLHPGLLAIAKTTIESIDFSGLIFNGLLAVLLFAGALHIDLFRMGKGKTHVLLLSTVGVALSALVFGIIINLLGNSLGLPLSLAQSFLLGAIISPTDPVAALAMLKHVPVSDSLKSKIAGESLFNDAGALLVFALALPFAFPIAGAKLPNLGNLGLTVLLEAFFGGLLGVVLGLTVKKLVEDIEAETVQVIVSLALATGTWSLATILSFSPVLATVCAGLAFSYSKQGNELKPAVISFWDMLDEILSAALFSLIGLELLILEGNFKTWIFAALAIPVALVARGTSVAASLVLANPFRHQSSGFLRDWAMLVWGGLRGAISIALVLALPPSSVRDLLLATAWLVCVFSILAQGLTISYLAAFLHKRIKVAE